MAGCLLRQVVWVPTVVAVPVVPLGQKEKQVSTLRVRVLTPTLGNPLALGQGECQIFTRKHDGGGPGFAHGAPQRLLQIHGATLFSRFRKSFSPAMHLGNKFPWV